MSIFGFRILAALCKSWDGQWMSLPRRDRSGERGFTLIEVLIVLAIIGMVASLVGPRVLGYLSDSKVKAARVQIDAFSGALDLFYLDNSRYPTTSEGLGALVKKPANALRWTGPYLRSCEVPRDPWGNPYVYRAPGKSNTFDILSFGPEGRDGAQNITNQTY